MFTALLLTPFDSRSPAAQLAESHRERERLGVKYADAKRARDELHVQVGRVRDEARATHDGRLAEELERLTQRSKVELDEIRGKQREAFEREIAGLREAREIAQVRLPVSLHLTMLVLIV